MGKPKHSQDTRGDQKGAQAHAEGQHGPKAHEARKAEISTEHADDDPRGKRAANDPNLHGKGAGGEAEMHDRKIANPELNRDGGHRLFENRTQHDDAEKSSEKNRRDIDMRRHDHDHDEFQGHGAHTGDPTTTPDDDRANVKNTGKGGGNRSDADRAGPT